MNFIYIDKKDGTGGFMLPDDKESEDIIEELLKNPQYVRRAQGDIQPKAGGA